MTGSRPGEQPGERSGEQPGERPGERPGDAGSGRVLTRARQLLSVGRWETARDELAVHLRTHPDDGPAVLMSGQCLARAGQWSGALDAAERAGRLLPTSWVPWLVASRALVRLGRTVEARAAADTAVRLGPDRWLAHVQRAAVGAVAAGPTGARVEAAAWDAAREAVRLAPDQRAAHGQLARLAWADGDLVTAELEFRAVLRLDPTDASARSRLADLDARRLRLGAALEGFGAAGRLDPADPAHVRGVGPTLRQAAAVLGLAALVALVAVLLLRGSGAGRLPATVSVVVLAVVTAVPAVRAWRRAAVPGLVAVTLRSRPSVATVTVLAGVVWVAALLGAALAGPWTGVAIAAGLLASVAALAVQLTILVRARRRIARSRRRARSAQAADAAACATTSSWSDDPLGDVTGEASGVDTGPRGPGRMPG